MIMKISKQCRMTFSDREVEVKLFLYLNIVATSINEFEKYIVKYFYDGIRTEN